jgi:hypothetical protein
MEEFKKIGIVQLFCRNGKAMLIQCDELDELLKESEGKDMIMVLPIQINDKHIQMQEVDAKEVVNLLPNTILTSSYISYFDNNKKPKLCFNSKPFSMKKLFNDMQELAEASRLYKIFFKF